MKFSFQTCLIRYSVLNDTFHSHSIIPFSLINISGSVKGEHMSPTLLRNLFYRCIIELYWIQRWHLVSQMRIAHHAHTPKEFSVSRLTAWLCDSLNMQSSVSLIGPARSCWPTDSTTCLYFDILSASVFWEDCDKPLQENISRMLKTYRPFFFGDLF